MQILIRKGFGQGNTIPLTSSRVTVGRKGDNDIPLLGDLRASRRHCELVRHGPTWTIIDVGSTNGTFVNGQRVTRPIPLHHGDVIRVGACELLALQASA